MSTPPPPGTPPAPEPPGDKRNVFQKYNDKYVNLDEAAKDKLTKGGTEFKIAEDGKNGIVEFGPNGLDRTLKKALGKDDRQHILYRSISSISHDRKRMGRDSVTVHISGKSFEWKIIADAEGFVDKLNAILANGGNMSAPAAAPASPAGPPSGMASKIAEVAALHEQGILDAEEFAAAKRRLIAEG